MRLECVLQSDVKQTTDRGLSAVEFDAVSCRACQKMKPFDDWWGTDSFPRTRRKQRDNTQWGEGVDKIFGQMDGTHASSTGVLFFCGIHLKKLGVSRAIVIGCVGIWKLGFSTETFFRAKNLFVQAIEIFVLV